MTGIKDLVRMGKTPIRTFAIHEEPAQPMGTDYFRRSVVELPMNPSTGFGISGSAGRVRIGRGHLSGACFCGCGP